MTISFLNSETLEQIGDPFVNSHSVDQHLGIIDYAWLDNGRFAQVTTSFQGPTGFSYAPNTMPERLEGLSYDCFFPATNSSDTNANGVYVAVTDGRISLSNPDPMANVFGCSGP